VAIPPIDGQDAFLNIQPGKSVVPHAHTEGTDLDSGCCNDAIPRGF
jgi:hypothetical protein